MSAEEDSTFVDTCENLLFASSSSSANPSSIQLLAATIRKEDDSVVSIMRACETIAQTKMDTDTFKYTLDAALNYKHKELDLKRDVLEYLKSRHESKNQTRSLREMMKCVTPVRSNGLCKHNQRVASCRTCAPRRYPNSWCSRCKYTQVKKSSKFYPTCRACYCEAHPDEDIAKNFMQKEKAVHAMLKMALPDVTLVHNKTIQDGCSSKRPDFCIDMGSHVIVIECDEFQHASYTSENKRTMTIFQDIGSRPLVLLRFNVDGYIDDKGIKHDSCFMLDENSTSMVKNDALFEQRITILVERIRFHMENVPTKELTEEKLFYTSKAYQTKKRSWSDANEKDSDEDDYEDTNDADEDNEHQGKYEASSDDRGGNEDKDKHEGGERIDNIEVDESQNLVPFYAGSNFKLLQRTSDNKVFISPVFKAFHPRKWKNFRNSKHITDYKNFDIVREGAAKYIGVYVEPELVYEAIRYCSKEESNSYLLWLNQQNINDALSKGRLSGAESPENV